MGGSEVVSFEEKKEEIQSRRQHLDVECRAAMEWFKEQGYTIGEAYQKCQEYLKRLEAYWRLIPDGEERANMQVQKVVGIDVLEKHTEWNKLNERERNRLLWDLGFNTRDFHTGCMERIIRDGSKLIMKEVVFGMERLDKEWLNKRDDNYEHYASFEAMEQGSWRRYGGLEKGA